MIEALLRRPIPRPTINDPSPAATGELSALRRTNTDAPTGTSAPPVRKTARTPNRPNPRTPIVAPTGHPSTIAERAKPAINGDFCITPCTKTGRNVVSPIITMPDRSEAPFAAAIGLRPQSSSEIIGSGDRRSWITNNATATTATAVMIEISTPSDVDSAVRSAMIAAMAIVNAPALKWSILPRPRTLFSWR